MADKTKSLAISLGITIAIVMLISTNMQNSYAQIGPVRIANDFSYAGNSTSAGRHILGEVINDGSTPITNVQVKARLFDKDGQLVGIQTTDLEGVSKDSQGTWIFTLQPHSKAGFNIFVYNPIIAKLTASYQLSVVYSQGNPKQVTLQILDTNFYNIHNDSLSDNFMDGITYSHWNVVGELQNNANSGTYGGSVIATLYDSAGRVIGVGSSDASIGWCCFAGAEPVGIPPNRSEPFTIPVEVPKGIEPKSVSFYAESVDSVATPEFAQTSVVGLVMAVAIVGIIAASYQR